MSSLEMLKKDLSPANREIVDLLLALGPTQLKLLVHMGLARLVELKIVPLAMFEAINAFLKEPSQ